MSVRNLDFIRNIPVFGTRLYEALRDLDNQHQALASQTNGNSTGQPLAPPAINSLKVVANAGHFNVAITDQSPIYRGISYFIEHADNPAFTNPQVEHIGASRNATFFFGNVTRYWRAYSAYGSSPASAPAYHGSAAVPLAVTGGGDNSGPTFQASQSSGTGAQGQGLQGPGTIPFRSSTGAPPIR